MRARLPAATLLNSYSRDPGEEYRTFRDNASIMAPAEHPDRPSSTCPVSPANVRSLRRRRLATAPVEGGADCHKKGDQRLALVRQLSA
ncbi:MAG: hypothetical protein CML23_21175 [Rhizobiaceae bacterium]|nr:hypothetical protein [Rhizobiaceae bacterium]